MGKILDDWIARNSASLATLVPGGGMRAPVSPMFQPAAPPQPGFGVLAPAGAPGDSSFMGAPPGPSSFAAPALRAMPVAPQAPPPTVGPTAPAPKGGKKYGVKHLVGDMSDEELNSVADNVTSSTGKTPEEMYTSITGSPPHKDMKKRELSEFLVEFGLGLLSQPAGLSDTEAFGRAGTAAYVSQKTKEENLQTQARADEQTRYERGQAERKFQAERFDKNFDRQAKLRELDIKEEEAFSKFGRSPNAKFNHYVGDDGYMYTYDEATGQGVRVVGADGKPIKPDPRHTGNESRKLDFEVKYNMYLDTYGARPDGSKLTGPDLQRVQKQALEFANRTKDYTDEEAQRDAVKGAVDLLSKDTNYLMADDAGKAAMRSSMVGELKSLYKPKPANTMPDASKLAKGMATPVTDEKGETSYWTLGEDGKPRQVDKSELH